VSAARSRLSVSLPADKAGRLQVSQTMCERRLQLLTGERSREEVRGGQPQQMNCYFADRFPGLLTFSYQGHSVETFRYRASASAPRPQDD
jgi:hypothetical protein